MVVVPRSLETGFLQKYEALADDMVGYGESGDRESVRGSPVVPDSAGKEAFMHTDIANQRLQ